MLAVVVVELVVVVVVLAEKHVLNSCNKITIYIKFGTLYLLYGHLTIIDIIPYVWLFSTYLDNLLLGL